MAAEASEPKFTYEVASKHMGLAAVIETAKQAVKPMKIDPDSVYVIGSEGVLDLERLGDTPRRRRGIYRVATVESFIDLIDAFEAGATSIWIDPDKRQLEAIFNDNGEAPGWGDFRAVLPLVETEEWKHWTAQDGKMLSQEAFAEHIEDGLREVVEPEAATMLELAQSMQASVSTRFKSAKRIADGRVQAEYVEEIEGRAGSKGQLSIPETFTLAIAPFLGEATYKVTARFRYRIQDGNLRCGYKLERPQTILLDALEQIKTQLDEKYDDAIFMGAAASPR